MRTKEILLIVMTNGQDGRRRLQGVLNYAAGHSDWNIHLFTERLQFDSPVYRQLLRSGIDGAIISCDPCEEKVYRDIPESVPVVILTYNLVRVFANRPRTMAILTDNRRIGESAAEFFHRQGAFASYGFLHIARPADWSTEREIGFRHRIPSGTDYRVYRQVSEEPSGVADLAPLTDWLKALPKPAALFAANDVVGSMVIAAARECGIEVPANLSVLGCDNDNFHCESSSPQLSSIAPDFENAGYTAGAELEKLMNPRKGRRNAPRRILLPGRDIIVRGSTAYVSPSVRLVEKAERYIADNALDGISSKDVVRALRVSRSLLDLRFRQLRGKSLLEAITDIRLGHLVRLIRTTGRPFGVLGAECGFRSQANLKRLFRRRYGMSMREMRADVTSFSL